MTNNITKQNKIANRNSGIELLKLIAILLIMLYHVERTISFPVNPPLYNPDYMLNPRIHKNIQLFFVYIFEKFDDIGNNIFFIASAWFMLSTKKINKSKWFLLLFEVWSVSVCILFFVAIIRNGDINPSFIIRNLLPNTFGNNWYITCYLLFYPIVPLLNIIIEHIEQKYLFRLSLFMFILYCVFIKIFFTSRIIYWISIYFIIAYFKNYNKKICDNKTTNVIIFLISSIMFIITCYFSYIFGININTKPVSIIIAFSSLNIMRTVNIKSKLINYFSSLSLLIYILHDNLLLKYYYKPKIFIFIHNHYGYQHILLWIIITTVVMYIFSLLCSIFYDLTIRKIILNIGNILYIRLKHIYLIIEKIFL